MHIFLTPTDYNITTCPLNENNDVLVCMTRTRSYLLQVSRVFADVTYSHGGFVCKSIDVISQEKTTVDLDAQDYLGVLDTLYSNQSDIGIHLFEMVTAALITGPGRDDAAIWLPLIQQLFYSIPYGSLDAIRNEYSYQISLAQYSIQLFTIFSAILLIWGLALLVTSAQNRIPEFSAFPDLDLISKIPAGTNGRDLYDISAELSKTKPFGIVRTFDEIRVYAQEGDCRINERTETFELGLMIH